MIPAIDIVKAFTDDHLPVLGNPAGVFIADVLPDEATMKAAAIRAMQPMTAFVAPRRPRKNAFDIRYYDLGGRVCHICGHATLAATASLARRCVR